MIRARTVLVVESSSDRGALAAALQDDAISIDTASASDVALAKIASNRYGVLLVDLTTARLSPAALSEVIRPLHPRPLVLALANDRRDLDADVIHGCLCNRSDDAFVAELIRDCLATLGDMHAAAGATVAERPSDLTRR